MLTQNDFIRLTKRISYAEFANYISCLNVRALIVWLSLQDEKTQRAILNLEPHVYKLIEKYQELSRVNFKLPDETRRYIILGLCIKIGKHIADNSLPKIYSSNNSVGYKEGIIKNNADIIENIIFEQVKRGNKKWQWSEVQKEFFQHLDKKCLKGNDKLKKDCFKIMTLTYFREMSIKYIFTKSKRLNEYMSKKDVNDLVEQQITKIMQNKKEVDSTINSDLFNTYNA